MKNKTILITGGSGSLGNALVDKILPLDPKEIRIFSRNEKQQFYMKTRLKNNKHYNKLTFIIGDIADYFQVRDAVRGVDIIFHLAAFKYLPQAETFVRETIQTNVTGSVTLLESVKDEKTIECCIGISTDKVCHTINVYGMTKSLMERLFWQTHKNKGDMKTKFIICRYGNVLGSSGSVIEIWKNQREAKKDLQITNPKMTRYIFTLTEAVDLVLWTYKEALCGDIISKEMSACSLSDLAEVMADGKVGVIEIGKRPGEKINECLIGDYESKDIIHRDGKTIIRRGDGSGPYLKDFTSDTAPRLTKEQLKEILKKEGWI